jgi:hypothetical protein
MSLVPFTNVKKKNGKKFVLRTAPGQGLPQEPKAQSLVFGLRFFFFSQFSTEGTEDKSVSVTQTEVEL